MYDNTSDPDAGITPQRRTAPLASDSPLWAAGGALLTGLATYGLLVLVARALGPTEYGRFAPFWAFVVIAGFGLFLPVEQVLNRRVAHGTDAQLLLRRVLPILVGLALAAIALVAVAAALGLARTPTAATYSAMAISAVAFAVQFPARGILAGGHRIRGYAAVVTGDGIGRLLLAAGLALVGVTTAGLYSLAVAATAMAAGAWALYAARTTPGTGTMAAGLRRELFGLIGAATCMQLLINSPVLLSGRYGSALTAGHVLAVSTLARIPLFVMQAGQSTYIGRIARAIHAGASGQAHRLVALVGVAVASLSAFTLVGAAVLGPLLMRVVFGADYRMGASDILLVTVGVVLFLMASVATDITVALGRHGLAAPTWIASVALSLPALFFLSDPMLRSTVPLIIGASVALALTAARLALTIGDRRAQPIEVLRAGAK